jgi:hypothetical protein
MKKWLDNYNNSKVTLPEGFVGMGNNTKGRNYSPAWGGQFAMGGSIPGAVGFTYARTQDPAPSNGKYAKKTLASAQNGQEMKFYQEGLDWKPKSISKNGKVIKDDRGQWAHPGEVTEIGSNDITMQGVDYPVLGVSDTGDTQMMYPDQDYKFDGNKVTEYPIAQDGENISKKLKKEAEERIERMKQPKATVSQYTPKKGEQAKFDKQKLERIAEENALLNKFARSKAAGNLEDAAMFAADIMTLGEASLALKNVAKPALKAAAKYATEKTALKNAYKLNPYAFKPNEANWYRQVGESAIDDAFNTGLIRVPREEVSPRMLKEFEEQLVRMQGRGMEATLSARTPASPYFMKGELFYPMGRKPTITKAGKISNNPAGKGSADYLIETDLPNESFQPSYVKSMGLGVPNQLGETAILKPNPTLRDIENFKFYKQHWLKGYKEVPKKKENGGWLNKYK